MAKTPQNPDDNDGLSFGPDDRTLAEELAAYREALRQEYATTPGSSDPATNAVKYTRDFFRNNLAAAAAQIVWLSSNSSSDAVRLNACKIIVKEALEDSVAQGDPLKDFFGSLIANNETPTPNTR